MLDSLLYEAQWTALQPPQVPGGLHYEPNYVFSKAVDSKSLD